MEQQSQEPNQQSSQASPIEANQAKSKRIKIVPLALAAVLLFAVGGILLLSSFQQKPLTPQPITQDIIPPQVRKSFATQEECEAKTGYRCDFVNCDVDCPEGFQKGWLATDVKIEEALDTSTWQTYRNEGPSLSGATEPQGEFGFEVRYPSDWQVEEYTPGAFRLIGVLPLTSERLPYIGVSSYDRAIAGISYCEAYPEHKGRCERFIVQDASGSIEWFEDYPIHAIGLIDLSNNITLAVSLGDLGQFDKVPDKIKEFFRTFLSTFRFVE